MAALLLIPLLVGGFIFCNLSPPLYYRLHRFDGQYLYLKAAQWGLIFVLFAVVLSAGLNALGESLGWIMPAEWFTQQMLAWAASMSFARPELELYSYAGWLSFVSISAVLAAFITGQVANRLLYASPIRRLSLLRRILRDSPLDTRLFDACISGQPVLITLETRKAYVARVSMLGEPNESEAPAQEIAIIPLLSGYRDRDTLELRLQNDYHAAHGDQPGDLSIIIRQADIVSVSWFKLDTYHHIRNQPGLPLAATLATRPRVKNRKR